MAELTIKTSVRATTRHSGSAGAYTWLDVRGGAGTSVKPGSHSEYMMVLYGRPGHADEWTRIERFIGIFDTSAVSTDDVILNASLWVQGASKGDHNPAWEPDICVVSANPAADDAIVAGDYDSLGVIALSNIISWDAFPGAGDWTEFVLTQAGIDEIVSGGITKFGLRNYNYDAVNSEPSHGAEDTGWAYMKITDAENNRPKLVITYDEAVVYPSEATIRVTGLIHRWFPGTYTLEMSLGAITTEFGLPSWTKEPEPPIPPDEPSPTPCVDGEYKYYNGRWYRCEGGMWIIGL